MGNMCSKDMGFYMRLLVLYKAMIYATIYAIFLQYEKKPKLVESHSIHDKYLR